MSEVEEPRTSPAAAEGGATAIDAGAGVVAAPQQPTQPVAAVPPSEGAAGNTVGPRPPVPAGGRPPARRRPGPLTVMGPWAPVAGALLGLIAGLIAVVLLLGTAVGFPQRLSLVLLVVGLSMLGAAGPLLADEVRVLRRGGREAAVPPGWRENARGLFVGLTPARLLLLVSAFVLFLSAYLGRG